MAENSPHVVNPQPPQVILGIHPTELEKELNKYLESQGDRYITKGGKEATRKVREDKHVLLAAVYSWPESTDDFDLDEFQKFAQASVNFFEKEHGVKCQSAVVHFDEEHPHVHVYGFHKDARSCHAGWVAKTEAKKNGASEKDSNVAYKEAMKGYQDRYFEQVTKHFGMERLSDTPRRRLTRAEWKEQKTLDKMIEARSIVEQKINGLELQYQTKSKSLNQQYIDAVEKYKKELAPLREQIEQAKSQVDKITQAGGVQNWVRKMAYGAIGRERPELAEARKLLEEKTRKAAEKEAAAQKQMQKAQTEIEQARQTLARSESGTKALKTENERIKTEVMGLREKLKQAAEPAKKIENLERALVEAEKEKNYLSSKAGKLENILEKFAEGQITSQELIEMIRPQQSSGPSMKM